MMKVELNGKDKSNYALQNFVGVKTTFAPKNEEASLIKSLFPVPISQQKISLKKATGLVKLLLGCYPLNEKSEHEIYVNVNVSTFQRYTFEEGMQVIDNLTAIKKFTPTRAEIIEAFNDLPQEILYIPTVELTVEEKFNEAWERIKINLEKQFTHRELNWFYDLKPHLPENGLLKIETPRKEWMTKNHFDQMLSLCGYIDGVQDILFVNCASPPTYLKDFSDEWIAICDILKETLNVIKFYGYIAPITPVDLYGTRPKLVCSDEQSADFIKINLRPHLEQAFKEVLPNFKDLDILWEVGNPTT